MILLKVSEMRCELVQPPKVLVLGAEYIEHVAPKWYVLGADVTQQKVETVDANCCRYHEGSHLLGLSRSPKGIGSCYHLSFLL
jgi:hypothetical protein